MHTVILTFLVSFFTEGGRGEITRDEKDFLRTLPNSREGSVVHAFDDDLNREYQLALTLDSELINNKRDIDV